MLASASAFTHFDSHGRVRRILHRLKYKGDRAAGLELGRLMALDIRSSARFASVDRLMAVPLHRRKIRQRGYNQSEILVAGMREVTNSEEVHEGLLRVVRTPSQTRKGRLDRWRNVKEAFQLHDTSLLAGHHVLLVDDVVTTGATLESCIHVLAQVPDIRISVYTAACA
ncbi:MAG: ComF family protein [Flavobacteriales bacterium]|nr:ComF family protein [Flavobacteriales bacterium]